MRILQWETPLLYTTLAPVSYTTAFILSGNLCLLLMAIIVIIIIVIIVRRSSVGMLKETAYAFLGEGLPEAIEYTGERAFAALCLQAHCTVATATSE